MNKTRPLTAFYLETLLLVVLFLAIILVITQVFGLGKVQSGEAKLLTDAVTLAENAAEAFYAAEDEAALVRLLDEKNNTSKPGCAPGESDAPHLVAAYYDAEMRPDPKGVLRAMIRWEEAEGLWTGNVSIFYDLREEPVYALPLCKYVGEGAQ